MPNAISKAVRAVLFATVVVPAASCFLWEDEEGASKFLPFAGAPPAIVITFANTEHELAPLGSATGSVRVTLNNISGPIQLEVLKSLLPPGVEVSLATASPQAGQATSYTVTADNRLPTSGTFEMTFKASAGGTSWLQTVPVRNWYPFAPDVAVDTVRTHAARVAAVSVSLDRRGGFVGPVSYELFNTPAGLQAVYPPPTLGTADEIIQVSVASSTPLGVTQVGVKAKSGGFEFVSYFFLEVAAAPAFDIVPGINQLTTTPGSTHNIPIVIVRSTPAIGPVALTFQSAVAGVTGSYTPNPATAGNATLQVVVPSSAAIGGPLPLTIQGTVGTATMTTLIALTIEPVPDLAIATAAATVRAGQTTTSVITITRTGSVGPVTLSLGTMPAGVSVTFPNGQTTEMVTGSTTTLNIATTAVAAVGLANISIQASAGSLIKTTTLPLTITAPPAPSNDFGLQLSSGALTLAPGASIGIPVVIARSGTLVGQSLDLSVVPNGNNSQLITWAAPTPNTGNTATLVIVATTAATTGIYNVGLLGATSGGSLFHTATIQVTIAASATADFSIAPTPAVIAASASGASVPIALAVRRTNSFNNSITFSTANAPVGISVVFNPVTAGPSVVGVAGSVTVAAGTPAGSYVVVFAATDGSATRNTWLTVVVP